MSKLDEEAKAIVKARLLVQLAADLNWCLRALDQDRLTETDVTSLLASVSNLQQYLEKTK